jgi:hypothetical protein
MQCRTKKTPWGVPENPSGVTKDPTSPDFRSMPDLFVSVGSPEEKGVRKETG